MTPQEIEKQVERAQQDPKHFDVLYVTYIDDIYRFVYYRVSSVEDAEDITTQVFMKALKHIERYSLQDGASFSSWLYQIARNTIIDSYRTKKETQELQEQSAVETGTSLLHTVDRSIQQEAVQEVLEQMEDGDKEILKLRLWDDWSHQQIAEHLDITVETARARYSRAVKRFETVYTKNYE